MNVYIVGAATKSKNSRSEFLAPSRNVASFSWLLLWHANEEAEEEEEGKRNTC